MRIVYARTNRRLNSIQLKTKKLNVKKNRHLFCSWIMKYKQSNSMYRNKKKKKTKRSVTLKQTFIRIYFE